MKRGIKEIWQGTLYGFDLVLKVPEKDYLENKEILNEKALEDFIKHEREKMINPYKRLEK